MTLIFDELAWIYVSKNAVNYFLVNSSTKYSLRRAKNVVFFLILHFGWTGQWGGYNPLAPATLLAMLLPIRISIALGPWHFGDFRNIFLPNVGETQKNLKIWAQGP